MPVAEANGTVTVDVDSPVYGTTGLAYNAPFIHPYSINNDLIVDYGSGHTALAAYSFCGIYTMDNANNHTVTLKSGEVTNIVGGYSATISGASSATGNTVYIYGGKVDTSVVGGWSKITSEQKGVTGNTINIKQASDCQTIDLSGATIYGGKEDTGDGTVSSNTINIASGVAIKAISGGNVITGNTINLGATGTSVSGSVSNIETIKLGATIGTTNYNVGFSHGSTVLSVGSITSPEGTTFDISGATFFTDYESAGTMTLLSSGSAMTGLKLKYSSAAAAPISSGDISFTPNTSDKTINGITLNHTSTHKINVSSGLTQITYNIANVVNSINLSGWNKTTAAVPDRWTSGLSTNKITAAGIDTTGITSETNILTTDTAEFFKDAYITGAQKYSSSTTSTTGDKNITFTVTTGSGVKASSDGKNLVYSPLSSNTTALAFGAMAWGDGGSGSGYTFSGSTDIDASNLTFTDTSVAFTGNPIAGTTQQSMNLLTGATGITAGTITDPTAAGKGTLNTSFTSDGIGYTGTAKGNVSVSGSNVVYTLNSGTLSTINLAGWTGTTSEVATGWTKNGAISVGGTFIKPTMAAGASLDILTATSDYFSDANIDAAIAYQSSGAFSNTVNGVTLSGSRAGGVKSTNSGKALTYFAEKNDTNTITFGQMAWGTARTADSTYDFSGVTSIDTSGLTFTGTATAADASTTLLTGATGLGTTAYTISPTTNTAVVDAAFTDTNGIAYTGRGNGAVSVSGTDVKFTLTGGTISGINLNGWTGTENMTLTTNWTGTDIAVDTGNFAAQTANKTLFTLDGVNSRFSGTVTGDKAYTTGAAFSGDEAAGVTLAGNRTGGIKVEDDKVTLKYYAETLAANSITMGNMTWGTGRTIGTGYDFTGVGANGVNATGLSFGFTGTDANTINANDTMELVTNASGLSEGLTVNGASHSQGISYTATNGATLSGTLTGTVSTATGKVNYKVGSKTLTGINLSGWDKDQAAVAVDGSWTKGLAANSINAAGFTAPELTANTSQDILTTTTDNFFNDTMITGAQKFAPGAVTTDEAQGVTFTGTQSKGVKASADGQKLVYAVDNVAVTGISLGNMTVGAGGVVTPRAVTSGFDFSAATTIDATKLKFDKPEDVVNSALVTGATNVGVTNPITGALHSQAITGAAIGNGITGSGTLTGMVSAAAGTISYTVGAKTLSTIDLSNWDKTANTSLTGWAGDNVAVNTGNFEAPAGDTTIFTTTTEGYFSTVTGAKAYTAGGAFSGDESKGVTLSGTKSGGVQIMDSGKSLEYVAESFNVKNISLGAMSWNTPRAMTDNYSFGNVGDNDIDASKLTFTFADASVVNGLTSGTTIDLLTSAKGLGTGLGVTGSPSQTVSYTAANVATLSGTLTGSVATAAENATTGKVTYTVGHKTLDSVDISAWNGTAADSVDASWEKNASGISVTGSGFTKPTTYGDHTILTATDANFFTGAKIDSSIAYTLSGSYSETEQNITLSGKQAGGVLANGSSLVYKVGTAYIDTIKLGKVTYAKDTVLLNKSDTNLYNYSNVNSLDKSSFVMSMTDEQKKAAKANDSMTLVKANTTLNDIAAQEASKGSYTYANTSANSDLTVKGTVTGNVAAASSNVIYTVASNTASALTINSVTWNSGTYARPNSEIAYSTALVNADNITFTGVDTLSKNDTMVLVSNYGVKVNEEVNKVRGGIFTLSNGKTGKGHAYYDSATDSLVYVVDRGVDDEVETKTAIGTKTIIINEQPHQGDVPGGEAEGDGEAKDNETIIKKSHIKKNPDGTGGDTNGGTSEDGDADKNKLDIEEESEIDGDATGGQSDTGNTDDNETIIKKKSIIHGGVAGGETLGGHGGSRRNKTTVEDSTVEGDVDGGKTGGDGETEENEVVITGSKIGGDVNGGHSGGDGDSSGNEVTVDNSTVDGDVNGGKSDGNGNTKNNKVNIKKGSKIGGSVHGGHSGGSGDSTGNEVTVDGSEVDGNVMGGRTKDGNANNNTVNIDGGSTINGSVYGGYSDTGDASGNNVNIGTGKINGDIYGGYSGGTGSTINNTVTLYGDADVSNSNIIGGSNGSDGNTLNIGKGTESWTGGGQTVKNISSFDTLNFTALPWNSDTPALTIGDGSATDLSNTTVTARQVAFTGVKTISVGSTMMFLDQSNVAAGKKATNINSGSDFTVGTAMEGTGKLVLDANGNVIYQVESAGVSRQTHNTVMAAEAAVVALNAGNDFILSAREGLARKENIGKDGIAVFAKIGGGATRQETGSHVNVNMWNGIVAVGRKNVQKESTTEYGVFVEHGWGNFSTHSDNAHRGDGSVDYTGGGLLGKWTKADGLYVEGSLRIGSMHEKANNLLRDTVRGYGYDERTTYKGFHLGVGKEFAIKDGNTVEVYGKYFYNRKDGMNFNAGLDEYNLDAVTSQILRVGARYTMKRERWNYYGDLSYEHELDGKAAGRANGMAIRGADTSGGSVRLELGAKLLANEKSPWTLDLNLTGYAGKKQGLQGGVSVKFMF